MTSMRLRDLERALSEVPPHPAPRADLEQVVTPPDLAARLLLEAHALGDVEGRRVVDLGCGTGRLALAAARLGAADVLGVDVDAAAVAVAREAVPEARFVVADVRAWAGEADTVVMNPPFGAQVRHADRPFLDRAFATAPVVYSLHLLETRPFVQGYAADAGFRETHAWALRFDVPRLFRHHEKARVVLDVVAVRLARGAPLTGRRLPQALL